MKSFIRVVGRWGSGIALALAVSGPAFAAPGTVVATVGPAKIYEADLDKRAEDLEQGYRQRIGRELNVAERQSVRRQALEVLVRLQLYRLDAGRANVTDAEIEAYLKRTPVFNPGGHFSQRAWENARHNNPEGFKRAVAEARADLGSERLAQDMQRKYTPSDEVLRRAAERALESADLHVLMVPRDGFGSRYREPTEREVLAEFHAHIKDFERPGEARLHAVELGAGPSAGLPKARLRERADSVITALRSGMTVSAAADRFGGLSRPLVLREDNAPGSWQGSPATNQKIFHADRGQVFAEPVPSANGYFAVVVDSVTPRRAAVLAEVAPQVRDQLRYEIKNTADNAGIERLYAATHDSLGRPGYQIRCAVIDANAIKLDTPTEDDLKNFYQSRLADYSHFDATTQALAVQPFEEVRANVLERWKASRRELIGRDLANRIEEAWGAGKRDKALESRAQVKELGQVAYGATLDLGDASRAVSDTLRRRVYDRSLEVVPYPGGYVVTHVYELSERVVPSLDQVREPLGERLRQEMDAGDYAHAKALYDKDPTRYRAEKQIFYSKLWCRQPELISVPLSRQEMETYYKEHLSNYGSPERFRVRHILVRIAGDDTVAARARAEDLVRRVRAGEDFGDLAERLTDDDKTRDDRGDLGYRSAGELAPAIQKVAFRLKIGQVSDPVRAPDGYHVLQLTEHVPQMAEPLAYVYTTVGADAALEKAQAISRHEADSLWQTLRTPEQARAAAAKLKLDIELYAHTPGNRMYSPTFIPVIERLERLKPGEMYPGTDFTVGVGAAVIWVDSIAAPGIHTWETAAPLVVGDYRAQKTEETIAAKLAEVDSLMRRGWSIDTLGALWGGVERYPQFTRRMRLDRVGATPEVDSLVFGTATTPPIETGKVSTWLALSSATLRLRVDGRRPANPDDVTRKMGEFRGLVLEYRLQDELKSMRQRYPVRIMDPQLRGVTLPALPPQPDL